MQKWWLLAVGGVTGTFARYMLAGAVYAWLGEGFPYGTLAVNTLGCLGIGFLGALADQKGLLEPEARLLCMIGFLGAFTTFSTLIYETWRLLQDGQVVHAGLNIGVSVLLGLAALWVGTLAASWL